MTSRQKESTAAINPFFFQIFLRIRFFDTKENRMKTPCLYLSSSGVLVLGVNMLARGN